MTNQRANNVIFQLADRAKPTWNFFLAHRANSFLSEKRHLLLKDASESLKDSIDYGQGNNVYPTKIKKSFIFMSTNLVVKVLRKVCTKKIYN